MYIDPNNRNLGNRLIHLLQIEDCHFTDLDASSFIQSVSVTVETIWESPVLKHYTDHGPNHSERVIAHFMKMDRVYHWSPYERLVFGGAALIHDIGMQFNSWVPEKHNSELPTHTLDEQELREKHAELGYILISSQLEDNYNWKFPPRLVQYSYGSCNALIHSAYIGFSHSGNFGDHLMDEMLKEPATWAATDLEGGPFRPRLLSAIFRICDELDATYTRITHPEELFTLKVGEKSKSHWLACLFVRKFDITIKDEGAIDIFVEWQIPRGTSNIRLEAIKTFLLRTLIGKINIEIEKVKKYLETCGERTHFKEISVIGLRDSPAKVHLAIPGDIESILQKATDTHLQVSTTIQKTVIEPPKDREWTNPPRQSFLESPPVDENKLDKVLLDWFNNNAERGHFELTKGEHTDTYVNCRLLVSQHNLLTAITNLIVKRYSSKKITTICAVGTSAIPLAVSVSARLHCMVTFIVSRTKLEAWSSESSRQFNNTSSRPGEKEYLPEEMVPILVLGEKILIIDDIISAGDVAQATMDLLNHEEMYPEEAHHFAIFKLGSREPSKDARIASYDQAVTIREVEYYPAESCPLCGNGDALRKETEMY
jgi:orotate phosphoribosyltransferase